MVKHEIKVEISKSEELKAIIEKAYFEEGYMGKIMGKKHFITIDQSDDINYTIFKSLNNATVKVTNEEVIDGTMRFIVDETEGDDIRLYPVSIYCIREDNKYIFY
jgi:hypothetical protein